MIWGTHKIRTRGEQLTARGVNSIGYGGTRDQLGFTTINHLTKPVPKSITESATKSNETKTRQELEQETGKTVGEQDYQDITTAVQNMLIIHGTSIKDVENPGIGPQHEGLTRMLSWEKKGSKHFYNTGT